MSKFQHSKRLRYDGAREFFLIMKLTFLAIFLLCMQVSAKVYSQEGRFSFQKEQVKLGKAFNLIERKSDYRFFYNNQQVPVNALVVLSADKASISQVLANILGGLNLHYRILDNKVIMITPLGEKIQPIHVTGTVTDSSGNPLVGVSVQVKGSNSGTVTDANGHYQLDSPDDATLIFSYIGYENREVPVSGKASLDVTLQTSTSGLNEVVVVGYGTQQKRYVTGSVASVSGNDIKNIPVSNVTNALAGRLPGVVITSPSGLPGVGSAVEVHGVTSYNGQDVLYVIDGVVRSKSAFDLINPADIESITVLKDAAASVYGVRGGNGVLLITTKRGQSGATRFTLSSSFTASEPTKVPQRLNSYQDALYRNQYYTNQGVPAGDPRYYSDDEIAYYKSGKINTDLFKLMSKTPLSEQVNLSIDGGSEKFKYYVSAGFQNETGLFNKISARRYTLLSNLDFKLSRDLSVSLNIQSDFKPQERPWWYDGTNNYQQDLTRAALNFTPLSPGYVNGKPDGTLYHFLPSEVVNNGGYIKDKSNTINGFLRFNYDPAYIKGFGAYVSYNYNKVFDLRKERYKPYPLYHFNLFGGHNHLVGDSITEIVLATQQPYDFLKETYTQSTEYTFDAEIHYNRTFGQHNIGLQFLYEQYESAGDNFYAQGQDLLSSTIDELFMANSDPDRRSINGSGSELGRESYFGRLNYRFKDRYLLQAMFRFDGSSVFAPENKWGFFPSVSAGWIISEEPFMKKLLPTADNLKLRASYGIMGYDDPNYVPLSQWYSYYSIVGNAVFGNVTNTIAPQLYPNPNIRWQKIANTDIGVDASFLNGLLSGSFDYYFKKTSDLLVSNTAIVPHTFGLPLAQENYGQVNANGFDLSIRHDNTIGRFKYYVGINLGYNTNKVIKYPEAANALDYQKRIGRPVSFITGYESAGIARTDDDLKNLPKYGSRNFELGDIIFKDLAGPNGSGPDGVVNGNDNVVLSLLSYDPKIVYGIPFGGSYRGFDLNILLQGVGRREVMFPDRSQWQEQNVESFWADAWTPENPNGAYPKIGGLNGTQGPGSSFWLRNGAYTRVKMVEIGYSLPDKILSKLHFDACRFYITGTNLFLLQDHIKVYDPELQTNITGYGGFQYPLMRTVTLGLNLNF